MKKALAGLGYITLTAGGDFHPALRTSAARMSNLTEIMACRRHPGKHLWHGETACPHASGTGRLGRVLARFHQFKDRFKPHDHIACFQKLLLLVDPDRQ
jgi:hypothetical protein